MVLALAVLFFVLLRLLLLREIFLVRVVLILGLWYGIWAVLVAMDLLHKSPDLTYGSDARYYWEAALAVSSGSARWNEFAGSLYVAWQAAVILTSPSPSFLWAMFANIAVLLGTFSLQATQVKRILLSRGFSASASRTAILWLALVYANGIVVWAVVRGLKEPLIWFFLMLSATSALGWRQALAAVVLWFLRPLGSLLAFGYWVGERFAVYLLGNTKLSMAILFFIIPLMHNLLENNQLLLWFRKAFGESELREVAFAHLFLHPILGPYLSILRFVHGPGPFRSTAQLLRGDIFLESTFSGDVLIFLGSVSWWILLGYVIYLALTPSGRRRIAFSMTVFGGWLVLSLMLTVAYSFIYFGTGDTRHRASLYVLSAPLFAGLLLPLTRGGKAGKEAGPKSTL
ncbi:hypothetical protein [Thermus caliditerrae]|uniref:hypothetical protein n=1 Tax=Thermus caliditerrae TaxID=1330700 RepID=UPI00056ED17F|nr:hypothetical protein [Thermus caliditerrae]